MREQRRLAAIVAVDVVGYARLMGRDESGTIELLREHRRRHLEPALARHGGRLVKLIGDGALIEFASAVEALSAAVAFQQAMAKANRDQPEDRRIVFRIGVHLGDLVVDGSDLYGDGVNVAARLEAEAPAGGIVTSSAVQEAVAGRLKATFEDLGFLALKNIERPIRAYRVAWEPKEWTVSASTAGPLAGAAAPPSSNVVIALPDKPSIAVLPFQNMSGDPEQEYFADGMTEDILTGLSRFQNLFVIARNSSFTYKGRAVDIKLVGAELGVRYVLEGSVRAAGGRIRVTAQLIEAASGYHVWAERYDRRIADLFDIQDEVTAHIVSAIDFEVRSVEARRPERPTAGGLEVWSQYHRTFPLLFRLTQEHNRSACEQFQLLVAACPDFALAHAALAFACVSERLYGWTDSAGIVDRALAAGRKAVELDDKDSFCHLSLARALLMARDRDMAAAAAERSVIRNPNSALAQLYRGVCLMGLERYSEALEHVDLALRLSPREPGVWSFHMWRSACYDALGDYPRAIECGRQAARERSDVEFVFIQLAVSLVHGGQFDEALAALEDARRIRPSLTRTSLRLASDVFMARRKVESDQEILRELGLPE
ncbi:MAG: adenylate/guanylate cyclase domain-containing protein [Reyranellaceae bacterium]